MTRKTSLIALCSALPLAAADAAPEWVHLLPAGKITTGDGRGPYSVMSMQALITRSLKDGDRLPIDENHITDKGAALGLAAPARGWIVSLEAREDGLWGRVEWTGEGAQMVGDRAYRGLSPVILHSKTGEVQQLLRASLTNTPNLQGLVSLHSEESTMDWKAKLIELLGLDSEADDAAIEAALSAKLNAEVALQSQSILESPAVIALQSQLTAQADELKELRESNAHDKAVAFVDGEIAKGRVGLKPLRDEYIALHSEDPASAQKLINGMAVVKPGEIVTGAAPAVDDNGLDAGDRQVMALMNISEDEYLARKFPAGVKKEAL